MLKESSDNSLTDRSFEKDFTITCNIAPHGDYDDINATTTLFLGNTVLLDENRLTVSSRKH